MVVNRISARLLERLGVFVIRLAYSEIWSARESRKARKPETVANLAAILEVLLTLDGAFCRQALEVSLCESSLPKHVPIMVVVGGWMALLVKLTWWGHWLEATTCWNRSNLKNS